MEAPLSASSRVMVAVLILAMFAIPGAVIDAGALEPGDFPQTCGGAELEWPGDDGHRVDAAGGLTPLVMVHGIDSGADHWREWIEHTISPVGRGLDRALFEQFNRIDGVAAYTFDYSSTSLRWIDDDSIGPSLGAAIDCLHESFDRPVIVVAHSMGGLATRWAANSADDAGVARHTKIATVITFGTPYLGSDLLRVARTSLDAASITGAALGESALPLLRTLMAACGRAATANPAYCPLTTVNVVDSDAGHALSSGSAQLADAARWPDGLDVHALASSIEVTQTVGLFFNRHQITTDLGDIAVSTPSATADATQTRTWTCPFTLEIERAALDRASVSLGFTSDAERDRYFPVEGWSSSCFHTRISATLEIANEAVGIVSDHINDQEAGLLHPTQMSQLEVADAFYQAFLDGDAERARRFTLPGQDPDSYQVLVRDRPSEEFLADEVWSCWDLYCDFMDNVTPGWKLVVEPRDGRYVVTGVLHDVGHPVLDWPVEDLTRFCVIDTTPLNLRSGPGIDHPAMTTIPVGDCEVYGEGPDSRWRPVRWQGRFGFVANSMLAPADNTGEQATAACSPGTIQAAMVAWWPAFEGIDVLNATCRDGWAIADLEDGGFPFGWIGLREEDGRWEPLTAGMSHASNCRLMAEAEAPSWTRVGCG